MHVYACCVRIHARIAPKFILLLPWYLLEVCTKFCLNPRSFGREIEVFTLPKVRARFHTLCMHVHVCWVRVCARIAPKFILLHPWYLLEVCTMFCQNPRSIGREIEVCTLPKVRAHFHTLCMQTNIINQLGRPIWKYAESFMKIWLDLAWKLRCVTQWHFLIKGKLQDFRTLKSVKFANFESKWE